jgi:hypothetical protein
MKRLTAVMIVALTVGGLWLVRGSSSHPAPPQTWEFKFEPGCTEKSANARGGEGWELVNYVTVNPGGASIDACIFKRPKS